MHKCAPYNFASSHACCFGVVAVLHCGLIAKISNIRSVLAHKISTSGASQPRLICFLGHRPHGLLRLINHIPPFCRLSSNQIQLNCNSKFPMGVILQQFPTITICSRSDNCSAIGAVTWRCHILLWQEYKLSGHHGHPSLSGHQSVPSLVRKIYP